MKKIDVLRTVTAVSLALLLHLVALYGAAFATPRLQRGAVVRVGPIVAITEARIQRIAVQAKKCRSQADASC